MFLAQTGHETDSYNTFSEYTNSQGTNAWCPRYEGGCTYRGRGAIQLTHRSNYARAGKELGVDFVNNPNIVATPTYAFAVGGLYWTWRDLNSCSDSRDMNSCTRKINGGTNGLQDRIAKYNTAKRCITSIGGGNAGDESNSGSPPPTPRAPSGSSCTVPGVGGGTCQNTDTTGCSGSYYRGYCSGAANIRCCVSSGAFAVEDNQTSFQNSDPTPFPSLSPVAASVIAVGVVLATIGLVVIMAYLLYSRRTQEEASTRP